MITNFEKFNESIKLSQAKQYTKIWKDANMANYMAKEFDNKYRIYLPIDVSSINIAPDENIKDEVSEFLESVGYEFENYNANLCKKIGTYKNFTKITKILQKFGKTELLIAFNKDHEQLTKLSDGYFVVISRHPVDIAGMTAGRRWKSCMDVDSGVNKEYVEYDVKEGSIIAYLIKNDDKNIENPLARILMKPYMNEKNGKIYLMPGLTYGTISEKFEETINDWLISVQGELPTGRFDINGYLYDDRQITKWKITPVVDKFLSNCCENIDNVVYDENLKTLKVECDAFKLKTKIEGFTLISMIATEVVIDCKFLQELDFTKTKMEFNMIDVVNFDSDIDNAKLATLFNSIKTKIGYIDIYSDKQITSLEFIRKSNMNRLRIYADVKNIEKDLNKMDVDVLIIRARGNSSFIEFSPRSNKCYCEVESIPNVYLEPAIFNKGLTIKNCENLQLVNIHYENTDAPIVISDSNITTDVADFNTYFLKKYDGKYPIKNVNFTNCTFNGKPYDFNSVFSKIF